MRRAANQVTVRIELIANRYRVVKSIGQGGMGTVWLCHDQLLDRDVAIKQIADSVAVDENSRDRIVREARLAASLNNPHAVQIYDIIDESPQQWLVMEYVNARNLLQRINESSRLSPSRSLRSLAKLRAPWDQRMHSASCTAM